MPLRADTGAPAAEVSATPPRRLPRPADCWPHAYYVELLAQHRMTGRVNPVLSEWLPSLGGGFAIVVLDPDLCRDCLAAPARPGPVLCQDCADLGRPGAPAPPPGAPGGAAVHRLREEAACRGAAQVPGVLRCDQRGPA